MERIRTKACPTCGTHFSYEVGSGNDRKYCTPRCRISRQREWRAARHAQLPACSIDGCDMRATRTGAGMCEMHYCRLRRTGMAERKPIAGRYKTSAGYIKLLLPNHELADSHGHIAEHRLVMFEQHNGECPACYWCGTWLTWGTAVVDHLNETKDDNRQENLVVACNDCNRARGAMVPFIDGLTEQGRAKLIELITRIVIITPMASSVPTHSDCVASR